MTATVALYLRPEIVQGQQRWTSAVPDAFRAPVTSQEITRRLGQ
jgi:hypothetical protein